MLDDYQLLKKGSPPRTVFLISSVLQIRPRGPLRGNKLIPYKTPLIRQDFLSKPSNDKLRKYVFLAQGSYCPSSMM
jgi:hypothetical protein